MSTASVQLTVSIDGGGYTNGAITASFGQAVALAAASTLNLSSITYEIYDYPPGFSAPAGWSTDPNTGTYFYAPSNVTTPPPAFNLPASGVLNWGFFMLRLVGNSNPLRLNQDGTPNTAYSPQLTDESTCIDIQSPTLGMQGIAFGLTTQFDSMRAWIGPLMQSLRSADLASSGAGFSAGGDLGGSSVSQITVGLHGATVPVAGALTAGQVLQVTGPSSLGYGLVNLATSGTGVLPVANGGTALSAVGANGTVLTVVGGVPAWAAPSGGGFTAGGDLGGSSTVQNVLAVHGASVPVAGALTTGNVLQVTSATTLGYGPVLLGGGAASVSGVLPSANQASQGLAGDASGTTAAVVVTGINGAPVPASGALTVGNVLQVSGPAALTYGPINLSNPAAVGGSLAATNGGTGLTSIGTADQLLGVNHAAAALAYFTAAGDVTLVSGSFTVTGLQTFPIATTTPTANQVLTWNAGTSTWTPTTPGSAASVTGSGLWHSTSGTLDGAASKGTAGQSLFTNAGAADVAWTTISGDISASVSTVGQLTVTAIQAHAVASTAPTHGQFFIQGSSSWAPVSLSGDVSASTVTSGLLTVTGLKGSSVPTLASGYLQWTGSAFAWTSPSTSSVTGSGFWHSTSGTLDGAASKGTAGQFAVTNAAATDAIWVSLSGDVTNSVGTAGSVNVVAIRGNSVSVTAATAGQVLIENAGATGSAWTTFSGDVTLSTGTPGLSTVAKVNGATVPAAGALTTGNSLHVSGASALSYQPLNLAGGAGWITGALPVANGGTGLSALGTADQLLGMNHAAAALAFFTLGGDATLASSSLTVTGLKGNAVPSLAAGYLQWTGSAFAWTAPAGIAVSGSGFWHSTSGTLDGAASKGTAGQFALTNSGATDIAWTTLTGDVTASTGTVGLTTVAKINGSSVPAGGGLTTGNVLQVSGSATLTYAALNLAAAGSITGVLATNNGGTGLNSVGANGSVLTSVAGAPTWQQPVAVQTIRFAIGTSTVSSTATIPSGAQVFRACVTVVTPYSGGATLSVGQTGSVSLLAGTGLSNLQTAGEYDVPMDTGWGGSALAVLATIAGSPSFGSGFVMVQYGTVSA